MRKTTFFKTMLLAGILLVGSVSVKGQSYHNLSGGAFTQDWSNISMILTDNTWNGVSSIIGYGGNDITGASAVDPQTLLGEGTVTLNVKANQTNPNTYTSGGFGEFEITNPVVAFQGSGTSDAPNLVIYLNTAGVTNISVKYNLRDIDGSTDNAVQPVALQYRVGTTGNFTNIPAAYVADASTGPSLATLVTAIDVTLPTVCENQSQLQLRIITSNAAGTDEFIGIDDINITANTSSTSTAATPTFSPVEGTYTTPQSVEITTTTPSASIYYTTNGSNPDNVGNGTLYTIPVVVNATTTLKARAYATGFDPSAIASAVYTFAAAPTITVTEVTVPALSAQIGNSDTEIINVSGANLTADIILTIDGANADMFSVNSPLPSSGGIATITYTPTANGLHTATLRLNSAGAAEETRTLNGSSILPAVSGAVIISEVYGGGGNSGATLINDFIELYNPTAEQVEIGGWSIQYYSAAATGLASNIYEIPTGKYIPSGAHFLIKAAAGTGGTSGLLQPDAQSTLTLGSAAGKIILYNTNVAQTISDLASITGNPNFVDYVPYGQTAVPVWGTAMSNNLTNTTSATRNTITPAAIGGQRVVAAVNYMYTGDINNDFSVVAPSPTSTGLNTGFNTTKQDANVYALNGKVVFQAVANQTVEIFNAVGQRIVSKNAVDGLNTIPVTQKGLLIVKVGNKVSKVIL